MASLPTCKNPSKGGVAPTPPTPQAVVEEATVVLAPAARQPSAHGQVSDSRRGKTPCPTEAGPYRLMSVIGEGGMGQVFHAVQEVPVRREVALKLIKLGMDTEEVIRRFQQERQTLALMQHPNIARVLDAGSTETGRPYFVMELVRGTPIHKYCDEKNLPTEARIRLFIDVCRAVQHAHLKGIIHRDLKPSNILVEIHDEKPVPKVIDFGIAKATDQSLGEQGLLTGAHVFVGTPAYASPEQADIGGGDVDTRTDVYSLGVILYELLTGRLPFDIERFNKASIDEMRRMIREEEPPRPSTRISGLTPGDRTTLAHRRSSQPDAIRSILRGDLDWIVMRALEKDRNRRYDTASELADDLLRHLSNLPVSARPPSTRYVLSKLVRRHRHVFFGVGAAAAALVLGAGFAVWQAIRATHAEHQAAQQRDRALEARQEADANARTSRAVTDFLRNDLLRQADTRAQAESGFQQQPNLTVKAALDRAAGRVGDRFKDDPLVEAEILLTIGTAYRGVGEAAKATAALRRAVALSEHKLGDKHPQTLAATTQLALSLQEDGNLPEALPLLKQVLQIRRVILGEEHPHTLASLSNLALATSLAGDRVEAIRLEKDLLKVQQKILGPEAPETLATTNNLAGALREEGRWDEAIPLHRATWERQKRTLGADHPDTLTSANNLAVALHSAGQVKEALPLYQETLEHMRKRLGQDHPLTLNTAVNTAAACESTGALEEALKLDQDTLRRFRSKDGNAHPDTLQQMGRVATLLQSLGRGVEALPLLKESHQQTAAALGPDHAESIDLLRQLALAEIQFSDSASGLRRLETAWGVHRTHIGSNDAAKRLGVAVIDRWTSLGRWEDVAAAAPPLLAEAAKAWGSSHPDTLRLHECIGRAHLSRAEDRLAVEHLQATIEGRKSYLAAQDPSLLNTQILLAETLLKLDRYAEAEPPLREALLALETADPSATFGLAPTAESLLAGCLMKRWLVLGRSPEETLREAAEHLQTAQIFFNPPEDAPPLPLAFASHQRETWVRQAQLCEFQGNDVEAAAWRAKLSEPKRSVAQRSP